MPNLAVVWGMPTTQTVTQRSICVHAQKHVLVMSSGLLWRAATSLEKCRVAKGRIFRQSDLPV